MIIYKIIEVSLDIDDPISTYANPNNNILQKLQAKYENKCFAGCFIMKVLTIEKRSECVIMQNTESCSGSINVKFRAQVIEFMEGEVLLNCLVIKKEPERSMLIAVNEYCALNISTENVYDSINTGQKIPVIIQKSLYSIGSTKAQAYAIPYIPSINAIAYNLSNKIITKSDLDVLKNIKSLFIDVYEKFQEMDDEEITFFTKLLYPYKNKKPEDLRNDKHIKEFKLDSIKEGSSFGIIGRPAEMNLNDGLFYEFKSADVSTTSVNNNANVKLDKNNKTELLIKYNMKIVEATPSEGLHAIWTEYYQRICMINDFINTYKTKIDKESHVNLWKIFNNSKK